MVIKASSRLLAVAAAGSLALGTLVGASAAGPTETSGGSGVAIVPVPTSPHLTKSGQSLDFGLVRPGATVSDQLVVRNASSHAITAQIYPADGFSAVGGGLGFGLRTDRPTLMGAWTTLSRSTVTVPANGTVALSIRVTVPPRVQSGAYAGGVVAEPPSQAAGSGGLSQIYRFAMAFYLKVPDGAPGAEPGRGTPTGTVELVGATFPVRHGKVCPTVSYRNSSEDIVNPDARVAIHPHWFGGTKHTAYAGIGSILPNASVTTSLPCQELPPTGGHIDLTLVGPHVSPEHAHRSIEVNRTPFPVILALLLLLLLLILLVWVLLRRRTRRESRQMA